jgi:hypothetical protein
MPFGKFLSAWSKDWTALMSGIASIALLFWAAIWPPSQDQLRHGLFMVSGLCFVIGSYRIWSREHQRWRDLTGKSQIEAITDLVSEFANLEALYVGDAKTKPNMLSDLIVKAREELRHHAPQYVHLFNEAVADPDSRPNFIPTIGRTNDEVSAWLSDDTRFESWKIATVCRASLEQIKVICLRKLP